MSIINEIEIKNFKSIRHQKIEGCKRINVFVGPPNVGKSNILEAMCIPIADQFRENEKSLNDLFRMERSSDLFYENNDSEPAEITINANCRFDIHNRNGTVEGLAHRHYAPTERDPSPVFFIKKYLFRNDVVYNSNASYWNLEYPFGNNLPGILSFNSPLTRLVSELLNKSNIDLLIDNELSASQGMDGKVIGRILLIKVVGDRVKLKIPYALVADTLRRLIFYLAAIYSNKNSILLLEEPEAHMYPPYISKFTSEIIRDKNNNQFFMATHSPFVLNDFMENAKDDLAIYLVDYKKETGETIINKMSDEDMHEAYQFGYDFFLNIKQFLPQST